MPIQTRFRITDREVSDVKSFPVLTEIPYFLRHHRGRLGSIDDIVAVVSNRRHLHPTFVRLNAFHRHRTAYAAVDALAPPLAEFFMQTELLPIVEPIFEHFKEGFDYYAPRLSETFRQRGILINPPNVNEE